MQVVNTKDDHKILSSKIHIDQTVPKIFRGVPYAYAMVDIQTSKNEMLKMFHLVHIGNSLCRVSMIHDGLKLYNTEGLYTVEWS
jgi:hypothetical protein